MPRKPTPTSSSGGASNSKPTATRTLHIAVQGCCHGELDKIYAECKKHEDNWGKKIDFLLCCGDFQSLRDEGDFESMAVPAKYRVLGDFHHYCCDAEDDSASGAAPQRRSEKKIAPYLTIFIGGNHEASNVLFQNYYGGYVAPNIYYLGHSGVIDVMGLRLAGLSGIWKKFDSNKPYPHPPYDDRTVRSAYHVRTYEVEKLSLFNALATRERRLRATHSHPTCTAKENTIDDENTPKVNTEQQQQQQNVITSSNNSYTDEDLRPIDIFLSHDWPVGITKYGDEAQLLRYKPYFGPDIEKGELGNPLTMGLLTELQPRYWCSAHLHCSFNASVTHTETSRTQFVALDKCVREKSFLDFIDITVPIFEDGNSASTSTQSDDNGNSGTTTAVKASSFSMMRRPNVAAARPPPKITIPPLWLEVLRMAQPSLARSYSRGYLSLFDENSHSHNIVHGHHSGGAVAAGHIPPYIVESITLQSPPLKPVTVELKTNVGQVVSSHWALGSAPASASAVHVPSSSSSSSLLPHPQSHAHNAATIVGSHAKRPREEGGGCEAEAAANAGAPNVGAGVGVSETVDDWLIEG